MAGATGHLVRRSSVVRRYGRPPKAMTEVGAPSTGGVRSIWSDFPSEGLTPDKLSSYLKAAAQGDPYHQAELFEEMLEKDTELLGRYLDRLRPVASADYVVLAGDDDDDRSVQAAEDAEQMLASLGRRFRQACWWLLDATGKGYAAVEVIWDSSPTGIAPVDFKHRHQKWFTVDEDTGSELRLLTAGNQTEGEPLEPGRWIEHRYAPLTGTICRAGLFRPLAWLYLFRIFAQKGWVQLLEILGVPMRIGRYPRGAKKEERLVLEAALENMGRDAWAAIPEDMQVEVIKTLEKMGGTNHRDLCDWGAEAYALLLLGQSLSSRAGDRGARSLGEIQWKVKQEIVEDDGRLLADTFSDQLLAPWTAWNYGAEVVPPRLQFQLEEEADLLQQSEIDERLQRMGYRFSERYIQETYKLPEVRDDDVILRPAATTPPASPTEPPDVDAELHAQVGGQQVSAEGPRPTAPEGDEQDLIRSMLEQAPDVFRPIRAGITAGLSGAETYDQAREQLNQALAGPRAELEALVFRATLAAHLRARQASRARHQVAAAVTLTDVPDLPNVDELRSLALRQGMTPDAYYALDAEHRARAFTIGGIENLEAIDAVQASLVRAERDGTEFAAWLDEVDEVFESHGIGALKTHRAELVFQNAVRQSQMAGRYAEERSDEGIERAPYWMYDAVGDRRTRPSHLAMDGRVFRKSDPIWDVWFPPNDHHCRCGVIEVGDAELATLGKEVEQGEDVEIRPAWDRPPAQALGESLWRYSEQDLAQAYGPIAGLGDPTRIAQLVQAQDGAVVVASDLSMDQLRRGVASLAELEVSGVAASLERGGLRAAPLLLEAAETQAALDAGGAALEVAHVAGLTAAVARMAERLDDLVPGAADASRATLVRALYPRRDAEVRAALGITDKPDEELVAQLLRAIGGGV